jgi:HemY protein
MIRILVFLALILAATFGLGWLADRPGDIVLTWQGQRIEFSLMTALAGMFLVGVAMILCWSLLRVALRLPSIVALAGRARRQAKGFAAVSRGLIAVGAGDARGAKRSAGEAKRLLGDEPMSLLLAAQAAQLAGDRPAAEAAFSQMLDRDETRVLGLRGLFLEARRKGDGPAARFYADEAYKLAPGVAWVGEAALDYRLREGDWNGAVALLDQNVSRRLTDKTTGRRQRAALIAASALAARAHEPDQALALAQNALKLDPGLVPAAVLAARRLSEKGDSGKAARILEAAWKRGPHPDLADAYLDVRPGDSARDRLNRARALLKLAPRDDESRLTVARAAIDAREFAAARDILAPLLDEPTARTCLLMAELEEHDGGAAGNVRQWLARASRARRDHAWVADGIVQRNWAPFSPLTGEVGAFAWRTPPQQGDGALLGFEAAEPAPQAEIEAEPEPVLPLPAQPANGTATVESAKVIDIVDTPSADNTEQPVAPLKPATPSRPVTAPATPDAVTPPLPDDPGPQAPEDEPERRPFKLFS